MNKVFNRDGWSFCNKYLLDFCSLNPPQRLQTFLNCFSVVLSTGYKPSGTDFLVWVPHGSQVLLVNQLLHGLLSSGSSFLQGMLTWSSREPPMNCSRDYFLSSRWTKNKTTMLWDLLNLIMFSWALFSSLSMPTSMSTALLNFMPSAHLLMMLSDHLPLPHLAMHFVLTSQLRRRFLLSHASFQPALFYLLHTRIESS